MIKLNKVRKLKVGCFYHIDKKHFHRLLFMRTVHYKTFADWIYNWSEMAQKQDFEFILLKKIDGAWIEILTTDGKVGFLLMNGSFDVKQLTNR